ncbi:MAG: NAD(P)-binding protein [Paracoccaceae bacterium]
MGRSAGHDKPDIVIGSGPSGVAVASALLARGRRVTMLDAGRRLGEAASERRDELGALEPAAHAPEMIAAYKRPQLGAPDGTIMRFGSRFAMEEPDATFADPPPWIGVRSSRARGGLSNVWGSAVLPYRQQDIADWPPEARDLAPHYEAVAEFMPVAGRRDAVQELLPDFDMSGRRPLTESPQAGKILARLEKSRPRLNALGVHAGAARQAVGEGCRLCGLCLYGCPYRLIFCASGTVGSLKANPAFDYVPGHRVVSVREDGESAAAACLLDGGGGREVVGRRVFLAAGVLETTRIMLASFGKAEEELLLSDSHYALMPMLGAGLSRPRPDRTRLHTLTQIFVEILSPEISPYVIHSQLYTYNDFYAREMRGRYGRRVPFSRPLFEFLGRRLVVAQTFLHSAHSGRIGLRLATGDGDNRLAARFVENPDTVGIMRRAQRRLGAAMRSAGLFALLPAVSHGQPGSSFHCGSTMPMRRSPSGWQSDPVGRPAGRGRVHVVDASVLPTIPATTITFGVMANAHRIGMAAPV